MYWSISLNFAPHLPWGFNDFVSASCLDVADALKHSNVTESSQESVVSH